jgi:hypothetical protein
MAKEFDFFEELPPSEGEKKESMTSTEQSNTQPEKKSTKHHKKRVILPKEANSNTKSNEVLLNQQSMTDSNAELRIRQLEDKVSTLANMVASLAGQKPAEYTEITKDAILRYTQENATKSFNYWISQRGGRTNDIQFLITLVNHFKNQK